MLHTRAAVSRGATGEFTIEDVELDDPRADEVLVRLVAAGVCHTDLISRGVPGDGTPAVFGHEGAGVVEAVGSAVTDVAVGDQVVLSFASCGTCARCRRGTPAYCVRFGQLNSSGARPDGSTVLRQDGTPVWSSFFGQSSFARHTVVARRNVVVVPPGIDLRSAAPMGCGFQTGAGAVVNVMRPEPDSSLVVFGTGGVGIAAVMAAGAVGVETVVAVDLSAHRRELAAELGATATVDGAAPDLLDRIRELTGGGADFAFDTTAVPTVIRTAARALGTLGELVLVGIGAPEATLDVAELVYAGKTVRGCIEGDADPHDLVPRLLAWQAEGRFPAERIVTPFPFEKINDAVAGAGPLVKPVLTF